MVRDLVEAFPESCISREENGKVPLVLACIRKASMEVVSYLLERCPQAAFITDNECKLALHWSCEYNTSRNVISRLVHADAESVSISHVDNYGRLPLHWICLSFDPDIGILKEIVTRFPEGVNFKDKDGNRPSDLVQDSLSNHKDEIIQYLGEVQNNLLNA